MNYYDNEVLIVPANATIDAIIDPQCGIYECPVAKKGQYYARAKGCPLFIAYKSDGEIKTLYRIKEVIEADFGNLATIKPVALKKRIDQYKKHNPGVSGLKWVFLIDYKHSIDLYYPVMIPSGARGNEYRILKEIFNSPVSVVNGRIVVMLPPKSVGKNTSSQPVNNSIL